MAANRNRDGSAKKLGKPKPTSGKGINKNIVTAGGKRGRAIENKMRSEMKLPKLETTGKIKSDAKEKKYGTPSRKVAKQNDSFVNQYSKYVKKNGSKFMSNSEFVKSAASKSVSPKQKTVPVKPRGGRGRGLGLGLGGGGGALRTYNR